MKKLFKLNNKGMTTVEILVSFVLVAMISASLYTTVSNYNKKMQKESDKLEINTYKNIITRQIQDDIIKNGLISVQTKDFHSDNKTSPDDTYIVDLVLNDHTRKRLVIKRQLAEYYIKEKDDEEASQIDDYFMIYYGNAKTNFDALTNTNYMDSVQGLEEFPLPDLGYGENDQGKIVKDFRLTNVLINTYNQTLSIFLGFQHVDQGTKYAINIVSPINYQS